MKYEGPIWNKISTAAKDLVKGLLDIDAGQRLTADQVSWVIWLLPKHVVCNVLKSCMSQVAFPLKVLLKEVKLSVSDLPCTLRWLQCS